MIKIYLSGSCSSCRKAKKWLRKHHIEFEEINLSKDVMKKDDLRAPLKTPKLAIIRRILKMAMLI